ncbi:MAG: hypothetical protein PWQ96_327 [Clostridia bacterium]|jgi:glycosyltransferase involved in cell wall biosynthesis|nr:hypothetical protein [Clostridia bacterium]
MKEYVSVIIPAYNEEIRIGNTLKPLISMDGIDEIVVVDDGSTDKTSNVAASLGVKVIKMKKNRGKGSALNEAAKIVKGSIIVLLDADLGESVAEVKKIIQPVLERKADIAIAAFPKKNKKSGFGLVKKFAIWVVNKYGKQYLQEPLSGQRAFTREAFEKVTPFSKGFAVEVITSIRAGKNNLKIVEIPTEFSHRVTTRNLRGFLHRGRQFLHILQALIFMETGRTNP